MNKKDNRGFLFPNKNKQKPTQPDMTGKLVVDGKEVRISAWQNKSPEGTEYLSISVSPLIYNEQANKESKPAQGGGEDLDLDAILNSTGEAPF